VFVGVFVDWIASDESEHMLKPDAWTWSRQSE